jgi:septum formation protein
MPRLVLASTSARRLDLVRRLGIEPDRLAAPDVDETALPDEQPRALALRLARAKAAAVERADNEVVLAGDTVVAIGRRSLGKAEDHADAERMLRLLSGRRHHVLSAIAVIGPDATIRSRLSDTIVAFKRLTESEIHRYLEGGEWHGKAGAYAIQGAAEAFVRFLAGSHSGVVGLPLFETRALLEAAGCRLG